MTPAGTGDYGLKGGIVHSSFWVWLGWAIFGAVLLMMLPGKARVIAILIVVAGAGAYMTNHGGSIFDIANKIEGK